MKILMFSDCYGTITTTFIRNEVNYLSEKYDFTYMACSFVGEQNNINIFKIDYKENVFIKKIRWLLWINDLLCSFKNSFFEKQLANFLMIEKPSVIHCHFGYESLKVLENIKDNSIPIFVHFHGYDASQMLRKKSYIRKLKKVLFKKNIYPIVVSEKIRTNLVKCGIDMSQSVLLHCGVDLELFNPIKYEVITKSGKFIFLQISSLAEKKGHIYTLMAYAIFIKKNLEYKNNSVLFLTGDGEEKEKLYIECSNLGIENNVHFLGNVKHEQAVKLLYEADVFVHHSITANNGDEEGIPTAIMEAMAMELPVLSTLHAGIPELVKHGVNGLLCNEKDIYTYAQQMEEIMNWKKLAINRLVIENDFNLKKHNLMLEEIYLSKQHNINSKNT